MGCGQLHGAGWGHATSSASTATALAAAAKQAGRQARMHAACRVSQYRGTTSAHWLPTQPFGATHLLLRPTRRRRLLPAAGPHLLLRLLPAAPRLLLLLLPLLLPQGRQGAVGEGGVEQGVEAAPVHSQGLALQRMGQRAV